MGVESATEAATVGSPVAWREVEVRLVASEVGSPVATVEAWVGLGVLVGTMEVCMEREARRVETAVQEAAKVERAPLAAPWAGTSHCWHRCQDLRYRQGTRCRSVRCHHRPHRPRPLRNRRPPLNAHKQMNGDSYAKLERKQGAKHRTRLNQRTLDCARGL